MSEKKLKALHKQMNKIREEMHQIAAKKGLQHPDVLVISEIMDRLHNEYNQEAKSVPIAEQPYRKEAIEIRPTAHSFQIIEVNSNRLIGERDTLEEAKEIAFAVARALSMDVYFLEQKLPRKRRRGDKS